MKPIFSIFIILFPLIFSCRKDEIQKYGTLVGVVQNELGQPIEGALIQVESLITRSDPYGKYSIANLLVDEYVVSVSKESFLTNIQHVNILDNKKSILNFTLITGNTFLTVSESILNINSNKGSIDLKIFSNAGWIIKTNSNWLECSVKSGDGNGSIQIKYSQNQGNNSREDTVHFISGSINRELIIHQDFALKLLKFEGIIGNGQKSVQDSVYLLFNKSIKVQNIKSNWEYCLSDIKYNSTDNSFGVKFTFGCARLGGEYPFTISGTDLDGNLFIQNIIVPFYKSNLNIKAWITDYLLINNDKEVLISAYIPSRIIRYSFELDSVIKTYDLSSFISPLNLTFNPYDSKVYIMGTDGNADNLDTWIDRPDVYTLDLKTDRIEKAFSVDPNINGPSEDPANIPYDLAFTKSGHGMIWLKIKEYNPGLYSWKLIDCTKNDSIYNFPDFGNLQGDYRQFESVQMNFDYTKLYLTQPYGTCEYGIFDGETQKLSYIYPSSITRDVFITANRKSEKFYAAQLYDQFVIDLDRNLSKISYLDNKNDGSADFSYRKDDQDKVYFCDNDYLRLMDYNTSTTPMWCDVIYGLKRISSTIDGKYAIAYKHNNDLSSNLFVFDTDCIYRHLK